ncbi:amidase [Croceicoccus sp. Ery15]|uniref:amidase n=1 Tax=Croceicoccus sp. Ery15 TaxID=1703338 RepID=UPI001E479785|nr:amidase [Croceicoccus sp. Ery15]
MHSSNRRAILKRMAAAGAIATGGGLVSVNARAAAASGTAEIADVCQPLTGLTFDAAEQQQALGAIDDIIDRARTIASLRLDNELPPAELFDPRLTSWEPVAASGPEACPPELPPLPTSAEDIAYAPAWQLSGWIRTGRISAVALTRLYLDRIAARAGRLNCIATLLRDEALTEAAARDRDLARGIWRGPLHGLPYGLKDLVDTNGIRTAWGAEPYRDRIAKRDATIVTRLREGGAVLLAKTSLGAIAYGDIWYGGQTRNPWNIEEGSSGSSAGSAAAVADGLCAFAIGTETMGSIIAPSARCGTVGLRPTFGRVPRTGAMALCWSLDKIGALARDPRDTLDVARIMAGPDGQDPCAIAEPFPPLPQIDPATVKLGYRAEWFEDALPSDTAALDAAWKAGFELVQITMPDIDLAPLGNIVVLEAAAAFEELTASGRDDALSWQDDAAWPNSWRSAHFETAVNYIQAQRVRRMVMQRFAEVMQGVDAILHPNDAGGLLTIGNHCGYPALIFPTAFLEQPTRTGFADYVAPVAAAEGTALHTVPFATTLTGRLFDEARLVAIGTTIADAMDLPRLRPMV